MNKLKMKEHDFSGKLITFCGLDGCGKSTMIKLLADRLTQKGENVVLIKQPSVEARKSKIFRVFMDCEDNSSYEYRSLSLMMAADRVQHCTKVIEPLLRSGKTIISDRYFYSCLANLRARGYQADRWIYEVANWIVKPDMAIFLDVDVDTAVNRVRERHDEKYRYIDMGLQYKLREEYLNIARINNCSIIQTSGAVEEAFNQILEII